MDKLTFELAQELIEKKDGTRLQTLLADEHPADIAEIVNDLAVEEQLYLFSLLGDETASEVLWELHEDRREELLNSLGSDRLAGIIGELETDEAADVISELEEEKGDEVLSRIDEEDSASIKPRLPYDEDPAGGLMQTEVVTVREGMRRDELIECIRNSYDDVENIHYVFVVDEDNVLLGLLELALLLLARPDRTARDLKRTEMITAPASMDQEEVANLFRKYDLFALPIVDDDGHLLGRITVDDIIDVIDREATEDAYRNVGLESEDRVFTTPVSSVRKRLPWLVLNLCTAFLVSSVVGIFEGTIARLSFLAVLMPIVAGLGGNSGTQTLTVITRGIAMGELTVRNTWSAVTKEITVGLINGFVIGAVAMVVAGLLRHNYMWGVLMGASFVANMFVAGLCGSLVPVVMKSMKIDPALGSSVIITMLTDMGGYASFLGLATLMLKHLY